jgi:hypothetical protein
VGNPGQAGRKISEVFDKRQKVRRKKNSLDNVCARAVSCSLVAMVLTERIGKRNEKIGSSPSSYWYYIPHVDEVLSCKDHTPFVQ